MLGVVIRLVIYHGHTDQCLPEHQLQLLIDASPPVSFLDNKCFLVLWPQKPICYLAKDRRKCINYH